MDRLDLRILKGLLLNNGVPPGNPVLRKSFRTIAKELGVDQGTIRKRMKAFQERRVLKGWYLGISPGVTGHDVVHAWFKVEGDSPKAQLTQKILAVKEVERVCNYLSPRVSLVLLSKRGTDLDLALNRLRRSAGPRATLHKQGFVPVPAYRPKQTDLAIIASLQGDPWSPYSVVAREIGVSSRTVKRRVSRLSEDGAIYMLPIIDLKALQGVIPVELVVDYSSPRSRAATNERIAPYLKEGLIFSDVHGPYGYFALMLTNVSQLELIANWVRQQEGVRDAQADVLQEVLLNRNHYEDRQVLGSGGVLNEWVKDQPASVRE
jgi:DNA-binding Lrp family transcriptional regulator